MHLELDTTYPHGPGSKEKGGASEEAGVNVHIKASKLREIIYRMICVRGPMTYKEVKQVLPHIDKDYIKPRLSELYKLGKLTKLDERRKGCTPYARAGV